MVGDATTAVFYAIFAIIFVTINVVTQDCNTSALMYSAVVGRYDAMPWNYEPLMYLTDVSSPTLLMLWLKKVFATVTFAEQPTPGSRNGYCTEASPCGVNDGGCDNWYQCAGDLTCGDQSIYKSFVNVNGNVWDLEDIATWCSYSGTPIDTSAPTQSCFDGLDLSKKDQAFCCRDTNGVFIQDLVPITNEVRQVAGNCPAWMPGSVTCCTDSLSPSLSIFSTTATTSPPPAVKMPATVGSFNRILMIRFSMKRFNVVKNIRGGTLKENFPQVMDKSSYFINVEEKNSNENTSAMPKWDGSFYEYTKKGSYLDGGGYVAFVNPDDGYMDFTFQIDAMADAGWFDVTLASLVVDMIIYNSNVDKFVHAAWVFQFNGFGNSNMYEKWRPMVLNLFDFTIPKYSTLYTFMFVLLFMVCGFVLIESLKIWDLGFLGHFRQRGAWVDILSLSLCYIVLISNFVMQYEQMMGNTHVWAELNDEGTRMDTFSKLERLAIRFDDQGTLVAVNLFVVFVRAVILVAALQSNLGLILQVLNISAYNILYFLVMFLLVMTGFVFFAFFTFGTKYLPMSDPVMAFKEVFEMLVGKNTYDELHTADEIMAPIFFYLFYVLFYLVMKNVFVSILMTGYDAAVHRWEQKQDKEHGGARELTVFRKIVEDLRNDVLVPFLAICRLVSRVNTLLFTPIWACLQDSFGSMYYSCWQSVPSCGLGSAAYYIRSKIMAPRTSGGGSNKSPSEGEKRDESRRWCSFGIWSPDCILMLIFMCNFVVMMSLQARDSSAFMLSQATLGPVTTTTWVEGGPQRIASFDDFNSFEDTLSWARTAANLWYGKIRCVHQGAVGYFPLETCAQDRDGTQLLQEVSSRNIGFLNTTFVRVTVQMNCYRPHKDDTSELVAISGMEPCASMDCTSIQFKEDCLTTSGATVFQHLRDHQLTLHKPGELGPARLHGGITISLGTTLDDAQAAISRMAAAFLFTKNTVSMVYDFVTYNGNVDLFVYNSVKFSLQNCGKFTATTESQAFPLNIEEGGGFYHTSNIVVMAMFLIYVLFVFGYVLQTLWNLRLERIMCSKQERPFYYFIISFYSRLWNFSDTISTILSIVSIYSIAQLFFYDFRLTYKFSADSSTKYQIPNAEVDRFHMVSLNDPTRDTQDDWFIFYKLEEIQDMYRQFLTLAALNSFFISIRVVKYVQEAKQIKTFSATLAHGGERIFYFTVIITLMLFGFAIFFTILYGNVIENMSQIDQSFLKLFKWIIGLVELDDLVKVYPGFTVFVFIVFMMLFYFIAVNMYLATMMNKYSETMGFSDIDEVKREVERDRRIRVVEYKDLDAFKKDITMDISQTGEIIVKNLLPEGMGEKFGVAKGHIIFKVNGERDIWRAPAKPVIDAMTKDEFDKWHDSEEKEQILKRIVDETIIPDLRDARVRVVFKDSGGKAGNFKEMVKGPRFLRNEDGSEAKVVATVKNFWRTQGAVTWILTQVTNEETASKDSKKPGMAFDEDDYSEDEAGAQDDKAKKDGSAEELGESSKVVRGKTKKRMDALLFSRWPHGRHPTGHGKVVERGLEVDMEPFEFKKDKDIDERGMDMDDLRTQIESLPVTGEEAWLDCLITAIEREMSDESVVTEVLRTTDMSDINKTDPSATSNKFADFYQQVDEVLKLLEFKARKKYSYYLFLESEARQDQIRKQNEVLHDYVWELEKEFAKVMGSIHDLKAQKDSILVKLSSLLGMDDKSRSA